MTEIDIYANVGRNDPCPCGSGKKYKKCHFRKNQTKQLAQKPTLPLDQFITPGQIPYQWYKGLTTLINRRDWALVYEVFQPDSPIHTRYGSLEAFVELARTRHTDIPAGGEFELRRFRLLGDRVFIMGARDLDNRRTQTAEFEVLDLLETPNGYRLLDMERQDIEKSTLDEGEDPAFEQFEIVKAAIAAARAKPLERPVVTRWDVEGVSAQPPSEVSPAAVAGETEAASAEGSGDEVSPDIPLEQLASIASEALAASATAAPAGDAAGDAEAESPDA